MIDSERRLYIRQLSAKLLLAQNNLSPVIDVRDMVLPKNIFILSFDEYSRITGYPVKELTHNGTYIDGYTIIADNMKIVLYSSKYDFSCPQRLRFSLAHEIGHIFLGHTKDDDKSEEEANYFASQVVAHDAIVVSMLTGNWNVDLDFIRDQLGISWDTAILKLKYINRNKRAYSSAEYQLFTKYKYLFSTHKNNRNKFATASNEIYVEFDEAFA